MRKCYLIIGSKAFFESTVKELQNEIDNDIKLDSIQSFMEVIRSFDTNKQLRQNAYEKQDYLIIRNNDYHGIVNTAHDRLGALIEELTDEDAVIFVHNPPRVLNEYLQDKKERMLIELTVTSEQYYMKRDPSDFVNCIQRISESIIGQKKAINEISKSLWYITSISRKKPYVIMLYGNSSLGKTELVREIAHYFFDDKVLEKHLSMFKNDSYSDYFFGEEPNRRSIGFDLLERSSNLIFFDEIDKCPEFFYSAFYTLFDNSEFKDATYDVDISGAIIFLTSNFQSEADMKRLLGMPIFYRIDKMIKFEDFSSQTIFEVTLKEIKSKKVEYDVKLSTEMVYEKASRMISTTNENARTIKFKVQQAIEELLFNEVDDSVESDINNS